MEQALQIVMQTYGLLTSRAVSEDARAKLEDYVRRLLECGMNDPMRLAVCGLVYLRQLDGRIDPVKAGFTGC